MQPLPDSASVSSHLAENFKVAGSIRYGDSSVSEQEHALQCAELADAAGADEELVLACLLHDVARFAVPQEMVMDTLQDTEPQQSAKSHGEIAAQLLDGLLPPRALFCIRYHGEAKQYLCENSPGYRAKLAEASITTMRIQARHTSAEQLATLADHRWWKDALRLRSWDDAAKVPGKKTRSLDYWLDRLARYSASSKAVD